MEKDGCSANTFFFDTNSSASYLVDGLLVLAYTGRTGDLVTLLLKHSPQGLASNLEHLFSEWVGMNLNSSSINSSRGSAKSPSISRRFQLGPYPYGRSFPATFYLNMNTHLIGNLSL